jgi:hypothetical protein
MVEYETQPFDPCADWFREVDERYEQQYAEVKRRRDGAEERRQQALREELKEQDRPDDKDLERRFKQQEKERADLEKKMREERERRQIEHEIAFHGGSGFHHH